MRFISIYFFALLACLCQGEDLDMLSGKFIKCMKEPKCKENYIDEHCQDDCRNADYPKVCYDDCKVAVKNRWDLMTKKKDPMRPCLITDPKCREAYINDRCYEDCLNENVQVYEWFSLDITTTDKQFRQLIIQLFA
ncbi:unnamed protein product [Cylicocyclus nassatus]|uniref:Uncharacterized protein n=1 Tax=Cylicocyclus nassatus TaxID=53992 RepID=A0AA36DSL1_CYLNA|nr:unnamed protein product [Cylicocyclus nassatus]